MGGITEYKLKFDENVAIVKRYFISNIFLFSDSTLFSYTKIDIASDGQHSVDKLDRFGKVRPLMDL